MSGIFKAYDIRGIYGDTLTEDTAFKIGRAFATFMGCKRMVVGRDARAHSDSLFAELTRGLTMQGVDVMDIGICSTPMLYFANGLTNADASIMITASHNPPEWNGFKLCRAKAIPISGPDGVYEVGEIVEKEAFAPAADEPGTVTECDILDEYVRHIGNRVSIDKPIKIVADYANSVGIIEAKAIEGHLEIDALFDELDGSQPNHEANPLKHDTLVSLQEKVRSGEYDFGVAFDGDADRAGFIDENGDIITMDTITGLIAQSILQKEKGLILYDLRSSWSIKEVILENGGTAEMSKVGHAFIKPQMRDAGAIFAGELSGHYYFRDNYYTESSALAVLFIASMIANSGKTLSELVKPLLRYHPSGEINSTVENPEAILDQLRKDYSDGNVFELDGLSVEYDDWWFNVRSSNTEPLLRVNIEAKTQEKMKEKRDEILAVIRGK